MEAKKKLVIGIGVVTLAILLIVSQSNGLKQFLGIERDPTVDQTWAKLKTGVPRSADGRVVE